jgi:hypothetical protein
VLSNVSFGDRTVALSLFLGSVACTLLSAALLVVGGSVGSSAGAVYLLATISAALGIILAPTAIASAIVGRHEIDRFVIGVVVAIGLLAISTDVVFGFLSVLFRNLSRPLHRY